MNWIQLGDKKIEIVKDFTYTGPLKGKSYHTMWSNFTYHSIKIKSTEDLDYKKIAEFHCKNNSKKLDGVIYKVGESYFLSNFEIVEIRVTSNTTRYKIIKMVVQDLEFESLPLQKQREFKLSELFEL